MRKLFFFLLIASSSTLFTSCKKDDVVLIPTIVAFTPSDGVGAASVVITGTNFSATAANNIVKFNGTDAIVTASTTTSITTSVPAAATTGTITVTVGSQSVTSTAIFRVDLLFKATLSGASEVPPIQSTATGAALLTYNTGTKTFTVDVTYSGLTPSAGHIHKGAVGTSGSVVYAFPSPISSPIRYISIALTAEQEASLIGGLNYVNLHTGAFPGGEIRGQLIKQ